MFVGPGRRGIRCRALIAVAAAVVDRQACVVVVGVVVVDGDLPRKRHASLGTSALAWGVGVG